MVTYNLANGDLSAQALYLGYIQCRMTDGAKGYYSTDADGVMLRYEGACFHVHTRIDGETHEAGVALWVDGVRADWQSFDTLGEARKAFSAEWRRVRKSGK